MKNIFGIAFLILLWWSCDNPPTKQAPIQVDYLELVKSLSTDDAKIGYLQGIQNLNEQSRKAERDALTQHGYNSEQHQTATKAMLEMEAFNIEKVEAYLKIWGYPDKSTLKKNAADMPMKIIHACNDLKVKRRNFKYLHTAFKNGMIPGSSFTAYLHKYYELSTGKRMSIPNPYSETFELDTLLRSLDLK